MNELNKNKIKIKIILKTLFCIKGDGLMDYVKHVTAELF